MTDFSHTEHMQSNKVPAINVLDFGYNHTWLHHAVYLVVK